MTINSPLKQQQNNNIDKKTVEAFDDQWRVFQSRQGDLTEQKYLFDRFFSIFPDEFLNKDNQGFEIGCGTGRFAQFVVPEVKHMTCVDISPTAIKAAKETLKQHENVTFVNSSVSDLKIAEESMDFGYSYGVLHHIPDTRQGIADCAKLLKPGAPFLIYMYYRFDNRPFWFKAIWWLSNFIRLAVCALPVKMRHGVCDILAATLYWPLARSAKLLDKLGMKATNFPLWDFRNTSFRRMRNNCRDRFGTPLEQRFTRKEMQEMLEHAGFANISFREGAPYWCAVGYKK